MKKLILLTAVAMAFVTSVAAESRVVIGYDMPRIAWTGSGSEAAEKFNGFSAGYIYGIGLGESGLGIDAGAVFQYGSYSETYYGEDCKMKTSSISIPVAAAYSIALGDNMAIRPYVGVNFRIGIAMKDAWGDEDYESYYSEDDCGDYTSDRFQIGYVAGVDFEFSKFLVGYQYGSDFGDLGGFYEDCKYRWSTIRVGFKF